MSKAAIRAYLARIGRKGGRRSRRVLSTEQAKAMAALSVLARKIKREQQQTKKTK